MAVDKMLVAFDESEGSKKALKTASELAAANPNAHIDLVYVVPIPMLNSDQMASFQSIFGSDDFRWRRFVGCCR